MKGKLTRGGALLTGGAGFESLARLGRNMILARLLAPESFGLMATIVAVVSTFEAFTEVGVRQAVIQNKKGSTFEFLNVALWFSSFRALFLFAIALLIAPLICRFYGEPGLLLPLQISCLALFFNGTMSPLVHVLEKEFRFSRWVVLRQGSAFLGVVVSLLTALYYKSVWALVLGYTTEYASICLFSYILCPFVPRFSIDKSSLCELMQFARGMFGLPLLTAVFLQIDIFAVGKLLTMEDLGLYSLAQSLALLPTVAFAKIVRPLLLPAFAEMQDNEEDLRTSIAKAIDVVSLLCIPFLAFCVVFSAPLLSSIYGGNYGDVWLPFSILVIYAMVRLFSAILMQLFFALARPSLQRNLALVRVILLAGLIYPLTSGFGLVGAACAVLFSMSLFFVLQVTWTNKLIGFKSMTYFSSLERAVLPTAVVLLPGITFRAFYRGENIVVLCVGFLLWMFSSGIALRGLLSAKQVVSFSRFGDLRKLWLR